MVKFLDEFVFLRIVKKYDGDKYVKHFSCWNQLLTLMFLIFRINWTKSKYFITLCQGSTLAYTKKVWSVTFIREEALVCPGTNKQNSTPVWRRYPFLHSITRYCLFLRKTVLS